MSKPSFVVPAADLERGPRSISWVLDEGWLKGVFAETEAVPQGNGSLEVELSKNGREVMVRGRANATVTMPCVVTLEPLNIELEPEIFLLLAPAPSVLPPNRASRAAKAVPVSRGGRPPPGGAAKGRKKEPEGGPEQELSDADAARDTYDGEKIVLDEFLREFLLLELPMYPRRSDLPSEQSPAIAPPSQEAPSAAPVDPRLMPLARIASRLRDQKKE
ncbi:MAG: YceD family protein [Myxococcota bacterium]